MTALEDDLVASFLPVGRAKTRIMAPAGHPRHSREHLAAMLGAGVSVFCFDAARMDEGRFTFDGGADASTVLADLRELSAQLRQPIATVLCLAGRNDIASTPVERKANDAPPRLRPALATDADIRGDAVTARDLRDVAWAVAQDIDVVAIRSAASPLAAFLLRKLIRQVRPDGDPAQAPLVFGGFATASAVSPADARSYFDARKLWAESTWGSRILPEDRARYFSLLETYVDRPIEAICEAFDGALVARDALAANADRFEVPFHQKHIIDVCRARQKPVIVSSELPAIDGRGLSPAAINDIATAVIDGADIIFWSGVTEGSGAESVGPIEELGAAIATAEAETVSSDRTSDVREPHSAPGRAGTGRQPSRQGGEDSRMVLAREACTTARTNNARMIIASATTGASALDIASLRPAQPIIAITTEERQARRLLLTRGIFPVVARHDVTYDLEDYARLERAITPGGAPSATISFPGDWTVMSGRRIRYALTPEAHRRLTNYLVQHADVASVEQVDHFFSDPQGVLVRNGVMVRLRRERAGGAERATLALRHPGPSGPAERGAYREKVFDLTPFLQRAGDIDVTNLPVFYKRFIWNEFAAEFRAEGITESAMISLAPLGALRINRSEGTVSLGLALQVDAFTIRDTVHYELGVEGAAAGDPQREEYLQLLAGALDFPIANDPDYPSRYARVVADAGLIPLPETAKAALRRVEASLGEVHPRRRRHPRVQFFQAVRLLREGDDLPGELIDLSLNGALVRAPTTFPLGAALRLQLPTPYADRFVHVDGWVARTSGDELSAISFGRGESERNDPLRALLRARMEPLAPQ